MVSRGPFLGTLTVITWQGAGKLFHCKRVFPFARDKYLQEDTLRLAKYSVTPQTFSHSF